MRTAADARETGEGLSSEAPRGGRGETGGGAGGGRLRADAVAHHGGSVWTAGGGGRSPLPKNQSGTPRCPSTPPFSVADLRGPPPLCHRSPRRLCFKPDSATPPPTHAAGRSNDHAAKTPPLHPRRRFLPPPPFFPNPPPAPPPPPIPPPPPRDAAAAALAPPVGRRLLPARRVPAQLPDGAGRAPQGARTHPAGRSSAVRARQALLLTPPRSLVQLAHLHEDVAAG